MWNPMLRKRAWDEVQQRRNQSSTYTEPLKKSPHMKAFLTDFYKNIYTEKRRAHHRSELKKYPVLEQHYIALVQAGILKYEDFWQRYEWRCDFQNVLQQLYDEQAAEAEETAKAVKESIERMLPTSIKETLSATTAVSPASSKQVVEPKDEAMGNELKAGEKRKVDSKSVVGAGSEEPGPKRGSGVYDSIKSWVASPSTTRRTSTGDKDLPELPLDASSDANTRSPNNKSGGLISAGERAITSQRDLLHDAMRKSRARSSWIGQQATPPTTPVSERPSWTSQLVDWVTSPPTGAAPGLSDTQWRKQAIGNEMNALIRDTQQILAADQSYLEPQVVTALEQAAQEVCYLKKYFAKTDEKHAMPIYFPSVFDTILNSMLTERAAEVYRQNIKSGKYQQEEGGDSFPTRYLFVLKTVARKLSTKDEKELDLDFLQYRNRNAVDVDLEEQKDDSSQFERNDRNALTLPDLVTEKKSSAGDAEGKTPNQRENVEEMEIENTTNETTEELPAAVDISEVESHSSRDTRQSEESTDQNVQDKQQEESPSPTTFTTDIRIEDNEESALKKSIEPHTKNATEAHVQEEEEGPVTRLVVENNAIPEQSRQRHNENDSTQESLMASSDRIRDSKETEETAYQTNDILPEGAPLEELPLLTTDTTDIQRSGTKEPETCTRGLKLSSKTFTEKQTQEEEEPESTTKPAVGKETKTEQNRERRSEKEVIQESSSATTKQDRTTKNKMESRKQKDDNFKDKVKNWKSQREETKQQKQINKSKDLSSIRASGNDIAKGVSRLEPVTCTPVTISRKSTSEPVADKTALIEKRDNTNVAQKAHEKPQAKEKTNRFPLFLSIKGAVLVLLGALIAGVVVQNERIDRDYLCGPIRPGTELNSLTTNTMARYVAPWWAPEMLKDRAFDLCCDNRHQTQLVWKRTNGKDDHYSLAVFNLGDDCNAQPSRSLLSKLDKLESAQLLDSLLMRVVTKKNQATQEYEAPWKMQLI